MSIYSNVRCPHLRGSSEGAVCGIISDLVKNIEGVTIKLCMDRHYEACSIYREELRKSFAKSSLYSSTP